LPLNIGVDGLKTGFTKEAGYGLVGSAVQNDLRLIVVVNGLKTEKERAEEARRLLEWGFNNFTANVLFSAGQVIADAKVYGSGTVPLQAERDVKLMVQRGVRERIVARAVYSGPVRPPVKKGQRIGVLKVWRGDTMALEVPLQAVEPVEQGALPRRALDAVSEMFYGLFRAGIQRL
jgi:D-alanyl-D-alanine carboxypeptidase (penicillin-binding protein 5/6)